MQRILVIDNYDSFTYNLVYLLRQNGCEVDVFRNDKISVKEAAGWKKILFSPGPGVPNEAGNMPEIIKALAPTHCLLGVCLGHQAIGESFGAKLTNLSQVYHGVATDVFTEDESPLFQDMPVMFQVGRYHSWVVDKSGFPQDLAITAVDENGYVMALQHKAYQVFGMQFHPESVLTPAGARILQNWIDL
jgi:anthranilate synthase component 2